MKIGKFIIDLQDLPLEAALDRVVGWGLDAAEVAAGGFGGDAHCPVDELAGDPAGRERFLRAFDQRGLEVSALNVNGNPLHPDPAIAEAHERDLLAAVDIAPELGTDRIVAMSGTPGGPRGDAMNWVVSPLDTAYLDILDYQWNERLLPLWSRVAERAEKAGVYVCVEVHSHTPVFNPPTMLRLLREVGSPNIAVNLDPSHLWWQGMDPLVAAEALRGRIRHAHGKDTLLNQRAAAYAGYFDDRWRRPRDDEPHYSFGGENLLAMYPDEAPWQFVVPGRGHDAAWWALFMSALADDGSGGDLDVPISIEHLDPELARDEGTALAASVLQQARSAMATGGATAVPGAE